MPHYPGPAAVGRIGRRAHHRAPSRGDLAKQPAGAALKRNPAASTRLVGDYRLPRCSFGPVIALDGFAAPGRCWATADRRRTHYVQGAMHFALIFRHRLSARRATPRGDWGFCADIGAWARTPGAIGGWAAPDLGRSPNAVRELRLRRWCGWASTTPSEPRATGGGAVGRVATFVGLGPPASAAFALCPGFPWLSTVFHHE